MDDFDMEDILNSNNLLKGLGWLFVLLILFTIAYLNGSGLKKTPLMGYAFITWVIIIALPLILNRDCPDLDGHKYYCLGELDDNIDDYAEDEMIGVSLQRSIGNIITTLIYFGFCTSAIAKYHGASSVFKKGGSSRKTGESFKQLTISLADVGPFSTMVYMALIIIIINVISNMYIYFNCEDKDDPEKKYVLRALIMAQYNIVIMTVMGIGVLIMSERDPSDNDSSKRSSRDSKSYSRTSSGRPTSGMYGRSSGRSSSGMYGRSSGRPTSDLYGRPSRSPSSSPWYRNIF